MTPPNPLQQLRDLDRTSPQFRPQLVDFLRGKEYRNVVPSLQGDDLTWLVEYLDSTAHDISDPASALFQESLRELRKMSGTTQVLPSLGTPAWKRLIDRPLAIDERVSLITDVLSDHDEAEAVQNLSGSDAQSFVDVVDEMLDSLVPSLQGKCLTVLCSLCSRQGLLPRSVQIPLCYNRADPPLCHGGFAEIWKGKHQGREVAVKVLKISTTSDLVKVTKRFYREVLTWKALRHENVLPLSGVTMSNNQLAMVSEWMVNGNINEFVKARRDANRFELLKDVARGLMYMHGQVMVHGDLKGGNILIDQDGRARLADFGLLTIVPDSAHPTTSNSAQAAGTTRWMAPELLAPEQYGFKNSRSTKESDCYAFGMVILEVLTGRPPFPLYNGWVVMRKVPEGERPERPQGAEAAWFTDDLWEALEQCWSPQPNDRPTVEAMLEYLGRGSVAWQPLPLSVDDGVQKDNDDESDYYHFQEPSQPIVSRELNMSIPRHGSLGGPATMHITIAGVKSGPIFIPGTAE